MSPLAEPVASSGFRPWFVTPAFGRLDVSKVVFDQRAEMIEELRRRDVEAQAVVIADDENLELARERGFETFERKNDPKALGMKWNDGYEYATLAGATHCVPIGSDSFLVADFVAAVDPEFRGVSTGSHYALIDENGERLARLVIGPESPRGWGVGPHVFPTSLLRKPFRPVAEDIPSGCDSSLLGWLERSHRSNAGKKLPFAWIETEAATLQYLALRTWKEQINPYSHLVSRYGVDESREFWADVAIAYPEPTALAIAAIYDGRRKVKKLRR